MSALQGLQPELFWRCFAEISAIPRPSGHEGQIRKFILDRAGELGLQARQDPCGNVVVQKPASAGQEGRRSLCLQAHLDMVCEKNADKIHDFLRDPIELLVKGDVITANGTTLGADNGIGVATSLAVMEDTSLVHGPLEFLFTVEEETGLTGARNLDPTLLNSRTLLNLDSEEEGVLFIGCAGGKDTLGRWQTIREAAPPGTDAFVLTVKGLKGGHSGLEIDKGLGNAIKILNRALLRLSVMDARLVSITGGNMRNAIPRECSAHLYLPGERVEEATALVAVLNDTFRAEFESVDPGLVLTLTKLEGGERAPALELGLQQRLCRTIAALPSGVQHMSSDIAGLVETSTNVSVITTGDDLIELITSQRSSGASRLDEVVETVQTVFELGGATVEASEGYPGWKPNLNSGILQVARGCYKSLYGEELKVTAIHAGLECGIIGERYPGMDMVSFGPTMQGVHSPEEKVYIRSVANYWEFLLAILKAV
jgi:dipeptidase D